MKCIYRYCSYVFGYESHCDFTSKLALLAIPAKLFNNWSSMHLIMEIMKQNNEHWLQNYQLFNELCIMSTNLTQYVRFVIIIGDTYLAILVCVVNMSGMKYSQAISLPECVWGKSWKSPQRMEFYNCKILTCSLLVLVWETRNCGLRSKTHHKNYQENIILQGITPLTPLRSPIICNLRQCDFWMDIPTLFDPASKAPKLYFRIAILPKIINT